MNERPERMATGPSVGYERRVKGIVLILVSGILVILALSASLFVQMVVFQGRSQEGRLAAHRAELAAESGMDYAAARLTREKTDMSAPRLPAARGDDWQYRGGGEWRHDPAAPFSQYPAPETLVETRNPSWSHGESWTDAPGGIGGFCDEGEGPGGGTWADLDGDERFSSWSGRLRGGGGALDTRFSLKVEPGTTCRLNVNGGDLNDSWSGDYYGFGIIVEGSCSVARGLNVLGVVLGMGNLFEIPPNPGASADYKVVRVSDLGNRLLTSRPMRSGYRSMEEVRQALSSGPAPLTDAQWRILEPHLTLCKYDYGHPGYGWNDLLDFQGTPSAFLHSHWMYRLGQARSTYLSYDLNGDLILSGSGASEPDPWIGRNFGEVTTLFTEEIQPLVQGIVERRREGTFENFDTLYRHAVAGMRTHGHAPAGANALERAFFLARKADLFMAFARQENRPDFYFGIFGADRQIIPPLSWATRGVDRNPNDPGDQTESGLAHEMTTWGFDIPMTRNAYTGTEPYDLPCSETFGPPLANPYAGFWFGPIRTFRVACRSVAGGRERQAVHAEEGDFLAGIGLRFQTQDHFENLSSRRDHVSANILPERPFEMERDVLLHDLGEFSGTQSIPRGFPGKSFWKSGVNPLPGSSGGVTLAEGEPDFVVPPMIRWEFTPDTVFDAAGTDGPEHARGRGQYPFSDNSPLALFDEGDPLFAYSGGQTTNMDLALEMLPTVGASFNSNVQNEATTHLTATDRGPLLGAVAIAPPVIAAPAMVPAPLLMLPCLNSDGMTIDVPVPSPQTLAEATANWTYTSHTLRPRWFYEGGFEAWVTQAMLPFGATVPLVKISAGGYQWSDSAANPLGRGPFPQEVSLEIRANPANWVPEYRLVSRYKVPAARTWSPGSPGSPGGPGGPGSPPMPPSYALRPTGYFRGPVPPPPPPPTPPPPVTTISPAEHAIAIPIPDRANKPGGGHSDHFFVEWKVVRVDQYAPADPQKPDLIADQMPRVEVDLRITLNGTVVHEQRHVTRLTYRTLVTGAIQLDGSGAPMFDTHPGFFPPIGRDNNGQNSYLDVEMHHCDQVALHNVYRSTPPPHEPEDRFLAAGTYESPRLVFGRGATLRWAGWTAAMSSALRGAVTPPVSCEVQGYADAAGQVATGGALPAGPLDAPAAWLDAPRCRSARFNVRFQVPADADSGGQVLSPFCDEETGAFTDPPVFEEFLLFVTDHPRWLNR